MSFTNVVFDIWLLNRHTLPNGDKTRTLYGLVHYVLISIFIYNLTCVCVMCYISLNLSGSKAAACVTSWSHCRSEFCEKELVMPKWNTVGRGNYTFPAKLKALLNLKQRFTTDTRKLSVLFSVSLEVVRLCSHPEQVFSCTTVSLFNWKNGFPLLAGFPLHPLRT